MTGVTSPCDLPHNERQISYLRSRSVKPQYSGVQDPMADQVFTIMQQALCSTLSRHDYMYMCTVQCLFVCHIRARVEISSAYIGASKRC